MREILRLCYKTFQYGNVILYNYWCTVVFRCLLWVNCVEKGRGIRAVNSIPKLVINRKVSRVMIGNGVTFNSCSDHSWYCRCELWVRKNAELIISDYVGMNGVMIYASEKVEIHDNVKIGGGTRIFDTNHHSLNHLQRRGDADIANAKSAPIVIEEDVFIGAGCFIGKGVTIGARSIIAAGSVVVKDIPADCIAGGNPCKVIKKIES